MIIYHNSRCGKSREALEILTSKGYHFTVREYLKEPPSEKELKGILKKLNCKAFEIVRTKEILFREKYGKKTFTNEEWISILCKNPILIERPIIVTEKKAIVARPPELLNDFLEDVL